MHYFWTIFNVWLGAIAVGIHVFAGLTIHDNGYMIFIAVNASTGTVMYLLMLAMAVCNDHKQDANICVLAFTTIPRRLYILFLLLAVGINALAVLALYGSHKVGANLIIFMMIYAEFLIRNIVFTVMYLQQSSNGVLVFTQL